MDIDKVRAHIRWARLSEQDRRPKKDIGWNQEAWLDVELEEEDFQEIKICTSTGCIAGHAVIAEGAKIIIHPNPYGYPDIDAENVMYDGLVRSVPILARELLGLTQAQADVLFNGDRSIDELEFIVHEWQHGNYDYDPEEGDDIAADCELGIPHEDAETLDRLVNIYYGPPMAYIAT